MSVMPPQGQPDERRMMSVPPVDLVHDEINRELREMVDEGLLYMGVSEDGQNIFWMTERGAHVLGMELV